MTRPFYADIGLLGEKLDAYERAEAFAAETDMLDDQQFADRCHAHLTAQAIKCGMPWITDLTIVEWSRRRASTFNPTIRRAA